MLHKLKNYIKARISQTTWFGLQLQSARNYAFEPYVKGLDIEGISGGRFFFATPQAEEWYDHSPIRKLEYEWVIENVKLEGQKVLDGGAHHGQYSVVFSLAASHQCHLVAVDPLPMNCALTEINLLLNNASARIEQCVISDRNGEVHFAKWNGSNGHINSDGDMLVKARTLDSLLPDADVVKLDVEGAEYAIVPSAIDKLGSVHTWIIEIHPRRKPHPDQIVKLLLNRGSEVLYVNPKKNQIEQYQLKTEWDIASTIIARR